MCPSILTMIHMHCLYSHLKICTKIFQMSERNYSWIIPFTESSLSGGENAWPESCYSSAFKSLMNLIMYKIYHLFWRWFNNLVLFIILPVNMLSPLPNNSKNLFCVSDSTCYFLDSVLVGWLFYIDILLVNM